MATVPTGFRDALRIELEALVAGERPDLLAWVREYGGPEVSLIRQPDEIWTHSATDIEERADGSAFGVLPLWTTGESPSDLSAEFEIDPGGTATIEDVRVL
ncbi:DUF7668 domain-containing protein [Nocardioides sp.]|uniref:DUF7668 domain-containing protein n=1 Tax=Nocardioides sp. TaxID=35761 RepID=UPI002CA7A127|nr:hypothetical protein [Nocardioides sp.]HXH81166.1 hypothetical protein [Nocardioides sp.]